MGYFLIIEPCKPELMRINKRVSMQFQTASYTRQAKMAYDQWQWYMEEAIDHRKYNRVSRLLVESVLEGAVPITIQLRRSGICLLLPLLPRVFGLQGNPY